MVKNNYVSNKSLAKVKIPSRKKVNPIYQGNVEILVDIKNVQKKVICITPICDKGMSFYNKLKLISDLGRGQNEVWKED